ncbi:MAG: [LysW]-aminoadipate/[LysW]-glutamate kinase [Crenarchaeota archaeon]|nr:MAG: [LysW]-aminoadipate/[LysW]-glutamate kinase [Thermoproteota archaeon]RDJ32965.1 MAG: [LysW]-aminoadipate/[LysW]-glutamate kinase [Thermoproteota archaeon]RDJ35830.1 MAG: [LysW]-aminoadipate/[LysW]-glutamate kinase [Thermoproteota archaeon]RDJ36530.1 MAG: [LysW]-aminoadipate/[LysW]-glutamate kinase [Thermoproteota archaeon]
MITIKIGGSVVDNLHPSTIQDIKKISQQEGVILVHGGGKEVTKVCEQLGKEPKFVTSPSGIKSRYTDKETAEIFTMVMSGRINKTIVQMLQKNGINAVGVSGVDAKTIQAERKKKLLIINEKGRKQAIDGGYTGKITEINADFIKSLLERGLTPVISPIAISEEGDFLNVDGDRAAAYVAGSVKSDKVLFVTNVDGLLMDDKLVQKLSLQEAKEIRPKIGPGMEKKILAATEALDMGVKQALIANGQKENPISSAIAHDNCTVIEND